MCRRPPGPDAGHVDPDQPSGVAAFDDRGDDPAAAPGRGPVPPAPLPPPAVRRIMSAAGPQAPSAGHSPYPRVVSPDAPLQGTASLRVLSAGYLGGRFAARLPSCVTVPP